MFVVVFSSEQPSYQAEKKSGANLNSRLVKDSPLALGKMADFVERTENCCGGIRRQTFISHFKFDGKLSGDVGLN